MPRTSTSEDIHRKITVELERVVRIGRRASSIVVNHNKRAHRFPVVYTENEDGTICARINHIPLETSIEVTQNPDKTITVSVSSPLGSAQSS